VGLTENGEDPQVAIKFHREHDEKNLLSHQPMDFGRVSTLFSAPKMEMWMDQNQSWMAGWQHISGPVGNWKIR
jgi:hypothetical protein